MAIVINPYISIPESELRFIAVRSAGPGGQNVNKVNSRVILEFDLFNSSALSLYQKRKLAVGLGRRVNQRGVLQLQAQRHRSQTANRADLLEKFTSLLKDALRPVKSRIPTRVPKGIREKRLEEKKQRGNLKRIRQTPRKSNEF